MARHMAEIDALANSLGALKTIRYDAGRMAGMLTKSLGNRENP